MTEPVKRTYTVRAGSAGEALVTSPDGRMEFMGVWKFFLFCLSAFRAGHNVEVKDERP